MNELTLRPVREDDIPLLSRFAVEPGLIGNDWLGCDYLFQHTPAQRIQAGTQPENIAEQKALVKAGFQLEGVVRAAEFRAGEYRDGLLYSRLRSDPAVQW